MRSITLNPVIFALILDEVEKVVKVKPTKENINLAFSLRPVNRYANDRLAKVSRIHLVLSSADDVRRVLLAGFPNGQHHESVIIRFHLAKAGSLTFSLFNAFVDVGTGMLRKVTIDLDGASPVSSEWNGRDHPTTIRLPVSVEELTILGLSSLSASHDFLRASTNARTPVSRIASCGCPIILQGRPPSTTGTIAVYLNSSLLHTLHFTTFYSVYYHSSCLVRLVFAEDVPLRKAAAAIQRVLPRLPEHIQFEHVKPPSTLRGTILDWFSARAQDGTIWTMEAKSIQYELLREWETSRDGRAHP